MKTTSTQNKSIRIRKLFLQPYLMLVMLLFGSSLQVQSQIVTITANPGTSNASGMGINNYHVSESIYTQPEINTAFTINNIKYSCAALSTGSNTYGIEIYMKLVTATNFGTIPPAVASSYSLTGYTLVYSGPLTWNATGFAGVFLTTPFFYPNTPGSHLSVLLVRTDNVLHTGATFNTANGNSTSSTAPTIRRYNSTVAPVAGTTVLNQHSAFRPAIEIGNVVTEDITVTNVYTLGKLPIQYGAPTTIRANIKNIGTNPLTNIDVALNISGGNTFTDLVNFPGTINPGQSAIITFSPYSPASLSMTDSISVTATTIGNVDLNLTNNTSTWIQAVTQNVYTYKNTSLPNNGGVGFNPNTTAKTATTGDFVAKFKSNPGTTAPYLAPPKINEVRVDFNTLPATPPLTADYALCGVSSQTATPQPYQIGIWDATGAGGSPGALLWTSPTYFTAAGTAVIPVPNVNVLGDYFVGVRQINSNYCTAGNLSFAYQTENPIRSGTFYFTAPTGGSVWTDFASSGSAFRFSIEVGVEIPVAPNCATSFNPTDNGNITCNNPILSWAPNGGAPTAYDVYLSTNLADVTNLAPAALVSANQTGTTYTPGVLTSSSTYYWNVIPKNVNGPASGCPALSFTTGSLPVCHCIPTYTGTICTASISEVSLNTLNNISTCFAPAHTIYPASGSTTTSLEAGGQYTIDVTSPDASIVSMWIDYNQNGIFEASEWNQVTLSTVANTPSSYTFIVPASATLGNTLMRIRTRFSGNLNGPGDACTIFGSGESEDYVVTIVPQPPCTGTPTPGNTLASATSACPGQTVTLSLQNYTNGSGVTYQWKNTAGNIAGANSMTYVAAPGDTYECEVKCNNGTPGLSTPITITENPLLTCYCNTLLHSFAGPCITNITLDTINNTTASACVLPAYTAFAPSTGTTTTLFKTNSYTLTRTTNTTGLWSGVWIDYNHDYVFDASEYTEISTTTTGVASNSVVITIPPSALSGPTGMRIRQRTIDMTGIDACTQNFGSGETEDYVVNLQVAVPCSGTPNAGTILASTTNLCSGVGNATLSLTGNTVGTGISYQWYNSSGPIGGANFQTFVTPNLTASETYYCVVYCNALDSATTPSVTINVNAPTAGSSLANPIVINPTPCTANTYSDTKTNTSSNCYSDNYTGANNQVSPNIWYQFTLTSTADVTIGHCGSGFDTYIHLVNSSGVEIASNDDNGILCAGTEASLTQTNLPAGIYYIVSEGFGGNTGAITTTLTTTTPCNTTLNLNVLIEGYWLGSEMGEVLLAQGEPTTPNACDSIDVALVDSATLMVLPGSQIRVVLNKNGAASVVFPFAVTGNYYIRLQHRNAIETWSAFTVPMAGTPSYNFTTSAGQAYGGNQKEVSPGIFALYSGDVVKDANEAIELSDVAQLEADNTAFAFGYVATDIDGSGGVDLGDFPLLEANVNGFIFSNHP
jgi:hypothetical protein